MRISFLGGTDEIGASSILVEADGRRLLVDCGLRQGARSRDPLPDLSLTQEAGGVDAILVTHAHFDHTGGLPVVHGAYPAAPIFMTVPTRHLVQLLLRDSLKIMDGRASAEGDIPLYPPEAVDSLITLAQGRRFLEPVEVLPGISVTFFPAGHILGAASVGIETSEGNVLISGDIAVTDQLTVPGMLQPRFRADAFLVESTYGDRLHASRESEERRLAETIGRVIEAGGKVLIPAFAIGRAQEVILILRRAIKRKWIRPFPIHVDGMVRAVCEIYASHPEWVAPALRRKIEKKGNPFWGEDDLVAPVKKPEERAAILAGPPSCIVSSSGMLTGGPSAFYARELAREEKNLIAITGYQDEESPGRALLDLASGATREISIGGERVVVACRVARYSLSAHADAGEIHGLVSRLAPRDLILVHGEGESRNKLATKVGSSAKGDVYLPVLGQTLDLHYRRRARQAAVPLSPPTVAPSLVGSELLDRVRESTLEDPPGRTYDMSHIVRRFLGGTPGELEMEHLRNLLCGPDSPLVPDERRPYLFRKRRSGARPEESRNRLADGLTRTPEGRLEESSAGPIIERVLGTGSGLLRHGFERDRWHIVLTFPFPGRAAEIHGEALRTIALETGWEVAINPESHQSSLVTAARRVLPEGWDSGKSPSIHREEERVVVHLPPEVPLHPGLAEEACNAFLAETGWKLHFKHMGVVSASAMAKRPLDRAEEAPPVEINRAYSLIREQFRERPDQFRKAGLQSDPSGPFIEVSFISAQVGERYRAELDELSDRLGWRLRINPRPDQNRILELVRAKLPAGWVISRGPGLDAARARIILRSTHSIPAEDEERLRSLILEITGFTLVVETR